MSIVLKLGVASASLALCAACTADPAVSDRPGGELIQPLIVDQAELPSQSGNATGMPQLERELSRQLEALRLAGKTPSAVPSDLRDQVALTYTDGALHWSYRNSGDYDQNGEVNVADLVPLSKLLGASGPFDPDSLESVVDGDGNGLINISDVTPIAVNFGSRVSRFEIYYSLDPLDYPQGNTANGPGTQLLGEQDILLGTGPGRRQFGFSTELEEGRSYWIRALAEQAAGIPSLRILHSVRAMDGLNAEHTGRSFYEAPLVDTVLWEYTGIGDMNRVVQDAQGTLYVGSELGLLLAIREDGSLKWSYDTGKKWPRAAAVGPDGTVYLGSGGDLDRDGRLVALDSTGNFLWEFLTGDYGTSSTTLGNDGRIYIGSGDNHLYCINANGSLAWSFDAQERVYAAPSIGEDGTIYFGSQGDYQNFYALNSDGSLKWNYSAGSRVGTAAALDADGNIYFGTSSGMKLISLDPAGEFRWEYNVGSPVHSGPAVYPDGSICFGSYDGMLYVLHPDGSLKWQFDTGAQRLSSPQIDARGRISIGNEKFLMLLDADGSLLWQRKIGDQLTNPFIGRNGVLYAGSWDQKLYAIGTPLVTLSARAQFNDHINLEWTLVPNASRYILQYRLAGAAESDPWSELATIADAYTTGFNHSIAEAGGPGQQYEYRIQPVVGADANLAWSNVTSGSLNGS